jgi:hypothetical protein
MMHKMQQQIQQLQQQLQQQQRLPVAAPAAAPLDASTLMDLLKKQQEAMQKQQLAATTQLLTLQTLGPLPTFTGKGTATGLAALDWLQRVERYFGSREAALGQTEGEADAVRPALAAGALDDDALRWYNALPAAARPTTWAGFRKALLDRYSSVPAVRVRIEQLRNFVEAARRLRDKMTLEGLQSYTSRFQQLAGEIPQTHLTEHGKLELLARGLSARLAETVLQEDAKDNPLPLHEVAQKVLAKAAFKEYAGSQSASAAASSGRGDPMDLDAISLCAAQFGVSREEAQRYVEPREGWAPYDTDGAGPSDSAPSGAAAANSSAAAGEPSLAQLLAALSRLGSSRDGKAQSQRRHVPDSVKNAVPQELATARRDAGLCIKCGVVKYEGGGNGHNSRTCKANADKTTSVAEGKKKAGF